MIGIFQRELLEVGKSLIELLELLLRIANHFRMFADRDRFFIGNNLPDLVGQ